jgi:hypothetical protein
LQHTISIDPVVDTARVDYLKVLLWEPHGGVP